MQTKKAISDIVSTVLIIMIAVAAVGIIGAIVVPMVRNSLQGGTACLNALSDVSVETQGTCIRYNQTENTLSNISVQIRKGTDATVNLASVVIHVMDRTGTSHPYKVNTTGLTLGGVRTFNVVNVINDAISMTLAPEVRIGNTLKQCDASTSSIVLVPCN